MKGRAPLRSDYLSREQYMTALQEYVHGGTNMSHTTENVNKTGELVAEAVFWTFLSVLGALILLNFVLGWNAFWPILGIGLGSAAILALFGYAVSVWVRAYRASRRTRT